MPLVKRLPGAPPSEDALRLQALADATARKARISARPRNWVPRLEQRFSLRGPLSEQVRPLPRSILSRAPTPAPTTFACRYRPSLDPEDLAEANLEVVAAHQGYGREVDCRDSRKWVQDRVPFNQPGTFDWADEADSAKEVKWPAEVVTDTILVSYWQVQVPRPKKVVVVSEGAEESQTPA